MVGKTLPSPWSKLQASRSSACLAAGNQWGSGRPVQITSTPLLGGPKAR